jgi:hypothetical protein
LFNEVRYTELLLLAWRGELQLLATQINKGIKFDSRHALEKMLYAALISESNGDVKKARENYRILGTWNPYFEEGVISAAKFFRKENADNMAAYNILVEAIQINYNSYRLMAAYAEEAERLGFDEYAASARERVMEIRNER